MGAHKWPFGGVQGDDIVVLRYHPARGTLHGALNGGAAVLLANNLMGNLVPAVRMDGIFTVDLVVIDFL